MFTPVNSETKLRLKQALLASSVTKFESYYKVVDALCPYQIRDQLKAAAMNAHKDVLLYQPEDAFVYLSIKENTDECGLPSCNNKCTQVCAACHWQKYCCLEHQKRHWKTHKPQCKRIQSMAQSVWERASGKIDLICQGGVTMSPMEQLSSHMAALRYHYQRDKMCSGGMYNTTTSTSDYNAGNPCIKPVEELKPICIPEMSLGIHTDRVLFGRIVGDFYKVIGATALLQDTMSDELFILTAYNFFDPMATSIDCRNVLGEGSIIAIKEPYYKVTNNGYRNVRVDIPTNIQICDKKVGGAFCGTSPTCTISFTPNDVFNGPHVEVRRSGVHGRGLFSTKHQKAGTVLLRERAFESSPGVNDAQLCSGVIDCNDMSRDTLSQATLIGKVVRRLCCLKQDGRRFSYLYKGPKGAEIPDMKDLLFDCKDVEPIGNCPLSIEQIVHILRKNSFGVPVIDRNLLHNKELMHEKSGSAIYIVASFINHAYSTCNTIRSFEDNDIICIRAIRDIKQGEEITTPYADCDDIPLYYLD